VAYSVCCSVLQCVVVCVAMYCSVLMVRVFTYERDPCVAVSCSVYFSILHDMAHLVLCRDTGVAVCCSVLQRVAVWYSLWHRVAVCAENANDSG